MIVRSYGVAEVGSAVKAWDGLQDILQTLLSKQNTDGVSNKKT
jgi:hypothetical protein